jgi:hypothetical protein
MDERVNSNSERKVDWTKVTRLTRGLALAFLIPSCFVLWLGGCSTAPPQPDNAAALKDIADRDSGAEIVVQGTIERVLPIEQGPSGIHERFIVDVTSGRTTVPLYVADNVSISTPVQLRSGEPVEVKGQLDFNDMGPVLHWTHRDPRLRHQPGFIEVGGRVYE